MPSSRLFQLLCLLLIALSTPYTALHHATVLQEEADCGYISLPACVRSDEITGITSHSCYSDGNPTIGAVLHPKNGTWMCEVCGTPNHFACECTHDNPPSVDPFRLPCEGGTTHWCFYEPQYVVTPGDDGAFRCLANASDAVPESRCGTEGEEACLDAASGVYSCRSPSADGATIRAMQPVNSDVSTATFMCERCGVAGARACTCEPNTPCPSNRGSAAWCDDGLDFVAQSRLGEGPREIFCASLARGGVTK